MAANPTIPDSILPTWKTGNRITCYFIGLLPDELWEEKVPGYSRKTIQMIGGHLHNTRRMWIKKTGKKFSVEVPESVDRYSVSQNELIEALDISSHRVLHILEQALSTEESISGFPDATHFMTYLVAHEAHHRGQILMAARQLDYELPNELTYGIWHWNKRAGEVNTNTHS